MKGFTWEYSSNENNSLSLRVNKIKIVIFFMKMTMMKSIQKNYYDAWKLYWKPAVLVIKLENAIKRKE
jgi:hypothetical protein